MDIRPGPQLVAAIMLACLISAAADAQVLSPDQPPGSEDALESASGSYAIENLESTEFDGSTPDNYFLARHQRRIVGLRFLSNSMESAVDYGPDSALRGKAYWDEYGLGSYYLALGGSPSLNQVWHTNFTNGEHRQLTDGKCITGLEGLSRDQLCVYNQPIASSVYRIAFVQEIFDYDPDTDGAQIPESIQAHLIVGSKGELRAVAQLGKPLPDHMDWSPDGKWLVYSQAGSIVVAVLTSTSPVSVTRCELWDDVQTRIEHPEWLWDGGFWIVYETASDIWRVPVKKPTGRRVCPTLQLNRKEQLTSSEYEDDQPQWMNYGNLVLFRSNRPVNDGDTSRKKRIWARRYDQDLAPQVVVDMPYSIGDTDWQRVRDTPAELKGKDAIRNANLPGGE